MVNPNASALAPHPDKHSTGWHCSGSDAAVSPHCPGPHTTPCCQTQSDRSQTGCPTQRSTSSGSNYTYRRGADSTPWQEERPAPKAASGTYGHTRPPPTIRSPNTENTHTKKKRKKRHNEKKDLPGIKKSCRLPLRPAEDNNCEAQWVGSRAVKGGRL